MWARRLVSLVGWLLLFGGGIAGVRRGLFAVRSVPVEALVDRFGPSDEGPPGVRCAIVSFRTLDGLQGERPTALCAEPPAVEAGQRLQLLIDPVSDEIAVRGQGWGLGLAIGLGLGGAVLLALARVGRWRRALLAWVAERDRQLRARHGRRVAGRVLLVEQDPAASVDGAAPFVVVVEWSDEDSGLTHIARSAPQWAAPLEAVGQSVELVIDPDDASTLLEVLLSTRPR